MNQNELEMIKKNKVNQDISLLDYALKTITPEELAQIRQKALEERLKIESENTQMLLKYAEGKKVLEDHIDTFNSLDKKNNLTRHKVNSHIDLGAGRVNIESKSGATCFVASATYDDPNHPDVIYLRYFRDNTLIKYSLGRKFIELYWLIGPKVARYVKNNKILKKFFKLVIKAIIFAIRKINK